MRFSKLRLLGFKSFVEPMEFIIENGLTGVVGPNGCGKSNLVEALRWVMGENSYKNMRASGMDDVIFSGSGNRPARNFAEVTLFLDNASRTAPAAFNDMDELQVSRRIEREAGSVYRINGKEVRAKDVQLLFADQSTGARSPSMVGQGRIGELIQAKPQARRALLEEAAGISGLHSRRHEAELRLRAAETNLERLDDVVGGLGSQIESLKRQTRQANRFKNLSADIRKIEATILHLRWSQAKTQEAEAQSALSVATAHVGEMSKAQMQAAKDQGIGAHHLPALRDKTVKAGASLQRLTIARSQLDQENERIRQRRDELIRRLEQLTADILREENMLRENADILERLDNEEQELIEAVENAGDRDAELNELYQDAAEKLKMNEDALASLTAKRAEALAERNQIERFLRETSDRQSRLLLQLEQIAQEVDKIAAEIAALPQPEQKKLMVEAAEEAVYAAEEALLLAEEKVLSAREQEASARQPLEKARTDLSRAETEAQTLSRILNTNQGEFFEAIFESVKVEKGYEHALGAAFGEDLEAGCDVNASFYWQLIESADSDPKLPDTIVSLAEFVEAPDQLKRRLSQIGIVDKSDGARLQTQLAAGQQLVTLSGDLWRWDGFTAGADAPSAAAQRLAQKNRLSELEAEIQSLDQSLRQAQLRVEQAEIALKTSIEEERQLRDHGRQVQRKLALAHEELNAAERASGQLLNRKTSLDESRISLETDLEEVRERLLEAEERIETMPDTADLDGQLAALNVSVMQDRSHLAEARAAYQGQKNEADARQRRLSMIDLERRNWLSRVANADHQIASLHDRKGEAQDEAERLAEAPDELEVQRQELLREISKAEDAHKQASDELVVAEANQAEMDKAAAAAVQALSSAREARARAEERLTASEERRKEAEIRIADALQCPPHEAIRQTGLDAGEAMPDIDQLDRQLDRLRIERERLGAVNLRAEEEQNELSSQLDAITSEREDIVEAIRKLRLAIQSLNKEGRERLLAAFDIVNRQFQRLFTHLFNGGTAELQLIESDDPLNAGLEILARPPGKKPQTMTLLSGGEQALTAMALIFAVFLTNPAPICVLDEVDAPLDDHNVERYCNLLDEMAVSTETRFVVITHNPITMSRMSRLFGVTMAEQGVSQLVSVDLQAAEKLVEVA